MSLTVTLHLWWLGAYLAAGVVMFLPLNYVGWQQLHNPPPFWHDLWRLLRRRPMVGLVQIVLWPAAVWEVFS